MSRVSRRIGFGLFIAVFSVVLLVAVVPQSSIPEWLVPSVTATGRFAGKPIRLATPEGGKPEVPAVVQIQMDQGTCRVSLKHGSELTVLFGTGEGYWRGRIPTGSELVLDAQGNAGVLSDRFLSGR